MAGWIIANPMTAITRNAGNARKTHARAPIDSIVLLRDLSNVPCMGASIVRMCSH